MVNSNDRPITRPEQDFLSRKTFVETLAKALVEDLPTQGDAPRRVKSKGNVVGLTGEWGSGKSSILYLLAEYLGSRSQIIVIYFNPWMFQNHTDLIDGFFSELTANLEKNSADEIKELLGLVDKYRESIVVGGSALNFIWPGFKSGWAILIGLIPRRRKPSAQESRKKLESKLKTSSVALVVLIDELDRVEDAEVRSVARLIKAVGDIPDISYLVAYDPKRVIRALGTGEGKERLAKLIWRRSSSL